MGSKKLEGQMANSELFDVIGTQIIYIDENGNHIGGPNLAKNDALIKSKSLGGDNQVANTSAIFKKKCLDDVKGWREDVDGIEDFDFWLRIMRIGHKFSNLPTHEVFHRLHSNSNFNVNKYDLNKIL